MNVHEASERLLIWGWGSGELVAYEEIASFFTNDMKYIYDKLVFGHMDYGKCTLMGRRHEVRGSSYRRN